MDCFAGGPSNAAGDVANIRCGIRSKNKRTVLAGFGQKIPVIAQGDIKQGQRYSLFHAKTAGVAAVPWGIIATAVGLPQHGHRKALWIAQAKVKIAFIWACDGRPAKRALRGFNGNDKIFMRRAKGVAGKIDRAAICCRKAPRVGTAGGVAQG